MDAGEVAHGAVAAAQDDAVRQRRFDDDQAVEAVEGERAAAELRAAQASGLAGVAGRVGAGAAADGLALARAQLVAVADELEGGEVGVAAAEEPRQLRGGGPQGGQLTGVEQAVVAGLASAVAVLMGHEVMIRRPEISRDHHIGMKGAQVETPAPTMRIGACMTTVVRSCTPLLSLSS